MQIPTQRRTRPQ